MRILSQQISESIESTNQIQSSSIEKLDKQDSISIEITLNENLAIEKNDENEAKLKQAVDSINEFLEINNNSSKFIYHEGLDRYFVEIVDKETEELVKEIPPKKLLDAFYEMQKLVGLIVDEKI